MHYRVDASHLHAKLVQAKHNQRNVGGWVGVGFAQSPNTMYGATAIIGSAPVDNRRRASTSQGGRTRRTALVMADAYSTSGSYST